MSTTQELVEMVREGKGRLMIIDYSIFVRGKPIGKLPVGLELEISEDRIELSVHSVMRQMKKVERARYATAFHSRRRSQVRISGRIPGRTEITVHFFQEKPRAWRSESKNGGEYVREIFHVDHIEIDGESAPVGGHFTVSKGHIGGPENAAEAHAIIPGVTFSAKNSSSQKTSKHPFHQSPLSTDTLAALTGEIDGYKYCIETSNQDVVFSIKADDAALVPDPNTVLASLMAGAAFTSGFQPWPFYFVTKIGRKITKHILRSPSNVQTDWHTPLRRGNPGDWKHCSEMLSAMAKLHSQGDQESKTIDKLLWIARQPCRKHVPIQVQLLAACAVLEGFRKPFDEEYETGTPKSNRVKSKHKGTKIDWSKIRFQEMFKRADISWQKIGKQVSETWSDYRNALAHGFLPRADQASLEDYNDMYISLVRISSAIQLYLLRKAQYVGPVSIITSTGKLAYFHLKASDRVDLPKVTPPSRDESP
jgi:hypothetical protein